MTLSPSVFSPLLTGISEIHRCAIQAMLESTECTIPCRLVYGTGLSACPNCKKLSNGKSANIYLPGGPMPFVGGLCPLCNSKGTVSVAPATETIELVVIFNPKDWVNIGTIDVAEGKVQTISVVSTTLAKLKRATSLVIGTDIEGYERHEYQRDGEPIPIGFGHNNFVITMWKKK